jgi:hypothetical protein
MCSGPGRAGAAACAPRDVCCLHVVPHALPDRPLPGAFPAARQRRLLRRLCLHALARGRPGLRRGEREGGRWAPQLPTRPCAAARVCRAQCAAKAAASAAALCRALRAGGGGGGAALPGARPHRARRAGAPMAGGRPPACLAAIAEAPLGQGNRLGRGLTHTCASSLRRSASKACASKPPSGMLRGARCAAKRAVRAVRAPGQKPLLLLAWLACQRRIIAGQLLGAGELTARLDSRAAALDRPASPLAGGRLFCPPGAARQARCSTAPPTKLARRERRQAPPASLHTAQ